MSAAKLIDSLSLRFSAVAIYFAIALLGCTPNEIVAPTGKTDENDVAIVPSDESIAGPKPELASTPSPSSEKVAGEVPTNVSDGATVQFPVQQQPLPVQQQPPPTDALALRQEAKQLSDELIRRFPNNPDALEIKARFLMLFGETEEAKNCWLAAIKVDANYAYALQGLGKLAILNSEFEHAVEYLKQSIPSQPSNADPVHDLSDAYMKLGKLDESIACLRTFADNNPQSALTFLLLGQSYLAKERFEDAETAFRTVLQISPGQPRAENGLATVLVRLGKRDEAKQLLANQKVARKANDKNRSPEEVFQDELKELSLRFNAVAEFYSANGELRTAEQIALRALVFNSDNVQPKALLVDILQKQDRLQESLDLVNQLSVTDNVNPRWPYTRGALLSLLGDTVAARQAYMDVVRLAPTSPAGYESLAKLAIGTRRELESAIAHASKLVEIRGSAADHELLAQAYAINGDYLRAHQSLSEAIRRDSANKDYLEAMKQLRKAMDSPK